MFMKLLLVAINAKYIHSNLAVYSLKAYAREYEDYIEIAEYTVNQSDEELLKGIYKSGADIVAFSCYIWNISIIKRLVRQLKKLSPQLKIWLGGPEVSYDAESFLAQNPDVCGIVTGEGEESFLELVRYYVENNKEEKQEHEFRLDDIAGLVFTPDARLEADAGTRYIQPNEAGRSSQLELNTKNSSSRLEQNADGRSSRLEANACVRSKLQANEAGRVEIISTGPRRQMSMNSLPFAYEGLIGQAGIGEHRIIYYESSRGCPFSCSYCLSSIDKSLRFKDIELVKKELAVFLEHRVAQVKFVDRTFNCNKKHAMEIWRFIRDHDNGLTNFHFEISADLLDDEELDLLSTLRPGQVQFEIGVQTSNPDSLKAINRRMDLDRLSRNVRKLREGRNIHLHLDLIAGLPLEDYASFENSFNFVYGLKPHQLQLGFLKILKGSCMEMDSARYGIVYRDEPPYEVLYTACLSYDEMLKLKGICEMIEVYYNSGQFAYSISFLEHFFRSAMKLYEALYDFYEKKELISLQHSRIKRYEILLDFFIELVLELIMPEKRAVYTELFSELLIYDLCLREKPKSRPPFGSSNRNKEEIKKLYDCFRNTKRYIHIESFGFDLIESALTGEAVYRRNAVIFDYDERDPISNSAKAEIIDSF